MPYEERSKTVKRSHQLTLEDRKTLRISGVTEVERFDEAEIVLQTDCGCLVIRGEGLNVGQLSVEGGEVSVSGEIGALSYEDSGPRQGLWARLFH